MASKRYKIYPSGAKWIFFLKKSQKISATRFPAVIRVSHTSLQHAVHMGHVLSKENLPLKFKSPPKQNPGRKPKRNFT